MKKLWWTLQWPNGEIDLDADNGLHVYVSKEIAEGYSYNFEDPRPVPVQIEIVIKKDKRRK